MPSFVNLDISIKAIVVTALLLGLVIETINGEEFSPETVCADLKEAGDFHAKCMVSEVVKQKGFIPKHLRPPWINANLFKDNEIKPESDDNCYACYRGAGASNGKIEGEEYCACHYQKNQPHVDFGKLFGELGLGDRYEDCEQDFYKLALMPKCGNENFDHIKHCAMVHFYKNNPNYEQTESEAQSMRTLVLLDGCVTGASKKCSANVKIEFREMGSSFFAGNCDEEMKTAFESKLDIVTPAAEADSEGVDDSSSFTFPVLLQHRVCSGLFSTAYVDSWFKDITVTIGGEGCDDPKSFKLQNLNFELGGQVQEMRGLELSMKDGTVCQWIDSGKKDFEYKRRTELKWTPTELKVIKKFGKSEEPEYPK